MPRRRRVPLHEFQDELNAFLDRKLRHSAQTSGDGARWNSLRCGAEETYLMTTVGGVAPFDGRILVLKEHHPVVVIN